MSLRQVISSYKFRSEAAYVSLSFLNRALTKSVDVILPPLCGICDTPIEAPGLCISCFQKMRPISDPMCHICGKPLVITLPQNMCGACLIEPPPLRAIRCAYQYNDASRALLLPFKHAGHIQNAATIAPLLRQAFSTVVTEAHIIIPIPLHWRRLLKRRYNQSAEIARRLCRPPFSKLRSAPEFAPKFAPEFLKRTTATDMLRGKSAMQRRKELKGVFQVPKYAYPAIHNRPVMLIDDVMTTGATLYEAARTLQRAGAGPIDAACFTRVL